MFLVEGLVLIILFVFIGSGYLFFVIRIIVGYCGKKCKNIEEERKRN